MAVTGKDRDAAKSADAGAAETEACQTADKCASVPLIWERIERAEAGLPKTTLTHQQIAEAAVALADADGIEAVTMRKLAERLGVATMALYRYVTGKDELYELMVNEAAYEESDPAADEQHLPWRSSLHHYAQAARTTSIRHPWLVSVSSMVAGTLTPRRLESTERAVRILSATGLNQTSIMTVLRVVESYVRGAVATEVAQRAMLQRLELPADGDARLIYWEHMEWALRGDRYPKLKEVIMSGAGTPDQEGSEFEIGLDCLLDGIATRYGLA